MIPEEHKDELVDASLHLMRALSDIYGSDRAMEFWHTLSDTIDPDLKGLTFSAMLTGRIGNLLTITSFTGHVNKIAAIKAIRTWDRRSLGLKEAKDMMDNFFERNDPIKLEVTYEKVENAKHAFKELGCRGIGL